jgi:hypothetical protein
VDMIRMYCKIVRRDAWARLLMVIGTDDATPQPDMLGLTVTGSCR